MVIKMNVPKLRFKEFTNDWKEYILNNQSDVRDGTHDSPKYIDYGFPLITSKNLKDNGTLDLENVNYLNKEDFDKINLRSKVDIGDILFGMIGTIGKPVRVNRNDFAIKNVALIKEKGLIKNDYLIHYLQTTSIKKQFANNMDGGTQKFIALEKIRKLKISQPNRDEQLKLVNMFNLLDKKIELQSQKIEALKLYKLCILKYIFSSATIKTKLKSVGNIKKGEQINSEELSKSGSYYMLNGGTEPSGYLEKYNTLENTITISEGGNSCGYVKYNKCKFWCGGHCYSIENKMIDNHYLYQLLKFNENKIMRLRIGSGLPNIQKKDLENFELSIHEKNDQHKIAKLLIKFDTKIELEQDLLNLLLNLKKGLIQNMFV